LASNIPLETPSCQFKKLHGHRPKAMKSVGRQHVTPVIIWQTEFVA
jgi:hypothetical protein